mgnify:CR=1 FL=1
MKEDLTQGPVIKTMLRFAVPMIFGNLLQQCYNIADTLIVGRFLGAGALAAVGSAFSLMTFLTSILLGLAMGSGTVFSIRFGQKDQLGLKEGILASFVLLSIVTALLNTAVFMGLDWIIWILRTPANLVATMREYLSVIFIGLAEFLFILLSTAFTGEFCSAAVVSSGFGCLKYCVGFMVCSGIKPRSGRSGGSHCDLPICFRHWNCRLHKNKIS